YYLIEGYRAALLGKEWYIVTHWELGLYFWGLVLVLMIIGSKLHVKFRNHLIDYLYKVVNRLEKAIVIDNVSKKYKLYTTSKERLFDLLTPKSYRNEFFALKNSNFIA